MNEQLMVDKSITDILQPYGKQQTLKIEDFLLSEIDEDNLQETIDFVVADDNSKKNHFSDELYEGKKYEGLFLEGNQYLLSSSKGKVMIIDTLSEAHGVSIKDTQVQFDEDNFIKLVTNKKATLNWIENYKLDQ